MGEEARLEQPKAEEKKDEKTEEKKDEPKPPAPIVLFVDLHCVGCAKKIQKSILRIKGVEEVAIDMEKNQVTIKGVIEPHVVCNKIITKTKRRARVLSPLLAADAEPVPEPAATQVTEVATLVLDVNMHCEACAQQLKKKILKIKGVSTVETELSSGKVTVTGTMDGDKLVEYVYSRTKKQVKIVPQPESEKPKEEAKPEENNETTVEKPADEEKPKADNKKDDGGNNPPKEEKDDGGDKVGGGGESKEVTAVINEYMIGGGGSNYDEQSMQRMMMYYYQPLYVIERLPPAPQLFSDENPNACSIA